MRELEVLRAVFTHDSPFMDLYKVPPTDLIPINSNPSITSCCVPKLTFEPSLNNSKSAFGSKTKCVIPKPAFVLLS